MRTFIFLFISSLFMMACNTPKTPDTASYQHLDTAFLSEAFETFKEPSLTQRRFTHAQIEPLINKLDRQSGFSVQKIGASVQGRDIYQIDYGTGYQKVMLWSQMHGDESTATMALFDLFNFLSAHGDAYDSVRNLIRTHTHLMFIPMLNPDGAERYERRNAMGIDINRDARSTTTPEASILRKAAELHQPAFGFNLHDQSRYYTAGRSPKSAAISFLAPTYNYERETNETRGRAMKLIVGMDNLLQKYIPGHVARYDDAHEPRGFGDNFQKWGASTILIESGGYPGDPEKQYLRKLNFVLILNALVDIADHNYKNCLIQAYDSIPENRSKLNDVLIRNLRYASDSLDYSVDVGIKRNENNLSEDKFYVRGYVDDVGDLQESYGYTELNADGLRYEEGQVYPTTFDSLSSITQQQAFELLKQGYFAVKVANLPDQRLYDLPIIVLKGGTPPSGTLQIGSPANFFLAKDGKRRYAVLNGYLVDLEKEVEKGYRNYIR